MSKYGECPKCGRTLTSDHKCGLTVDEWQEELVAKFGPIFEDECIKARKELKVSLRKWRKRNAK